MYVTKADYDTICALSGLVADLLEKGAESEEILQLSEDAGRLEEKMGNAWHNQKYRSEVAREVRKFREE